MCLSLRVMLLLCLRLLLLKLLQLLLLRPRVCLLQREALMLCLHLLLLCLMMPWVVMRKGRLPKCRRRGVDVCKPSVGGMGGGGLGVHAKISKGHVDEPAFVAAAGCHRTP